MTADELLWQLPMVPFRFEGRDLKGMDCFGLVEFWHREVLGIEVDDRITQPSEPLGFEQGYEAQKDWSEIEEPENNAVAVMKAHWNGVIHQYGHCGIVWNGRVYHFKPDQGFQHSPVGDRQLRITKYMKHVKCKEF